MKWRGTISRKFCLLVYSKILMLHFLKYKVKHFWGCDGLSSGTSVSGGDGLVVSSGGGLITQPGGGGLLTQSGGGLLVPSVQVQVPQVLVAQPAQFPSAMNVIPQQQPLLNLQPMQPSLFNIQQPKISTQCCAVRSELLFHFWTFYYPVIWNIFWLVQVNAVLKDAIIDWLFEGAQVTPTNSLFSLKNR